MTDILPYTLAGALRAIDETLRQHPEMARGNSKVHYAVHKARAALTAWEARPNPVEPTVRLCPYCGSDDIAADAAARWDGFEWTVSNTFDDCTCQACDREFNTYDALTEPRA